MRRIVHGPEAPAPRPRFAFLDGLRGLAALYVLLHHAALEAPEHQRGVAAVARGFLRHGHYAVAVFIVVSGACLALPVVRDPRGRVAGGFVAYIGRRARRILPPYYAALALCWLLIAIVPALRSDDSVRWSFALPATTPRVVATHLLLVHNLDPGSIFKIDPPLWSVATEWQIYLLFPLLLAIRLRWGIGATVASGFASGVSLAATADLVGNPALRLLGPQYVGLFTLGMAAVESSWRPNSGPRRPLAWACGAAATLAVPAWLRPSGADHLILDPVVGALTAVVIARCFRRHLDGTTSAVLRLLESRVAARLGAISYSLYLIHFPLVAIVGAAVRDLGLGPGADLAAMLGFATPVSLASATLFHRLFERPFLPGGSRPDRPPGVLPQRSVQPVEVAEVGRRVVEST